MHPMVLRKPLGGFAIGTPSFYQNHWVLFAKASGGFTKTIGCKSPALGGPTIYVEKNKKSGQDMRTLAGMSAEWLVSS